MTGIMKKTEAQRLKMVIDQRDSEIAYLSRKLDEALAEIRKLKAENTPAQLHADRVAQMISEDRD